MSAHATTLGDALTAPARAPRRAASRPRDGGAETIATLADAEEQIVSAARDLAYLAGELGRVTAESERRGAALLDAREECGRLSTRMAALEQLAANVASRVTADRARADTRVQAARDQAAAAIASAEERASAALLAAHETVCGTAEAWETAVARAVAAEHEVVAVAQARADMEAREAAGAGDAAASRTAAQREAEPQTARERRLSAELEHLRRERTEHEERWRTELDLARTEKLELRTRLSMCEHALAERERELQRERKLADEAMRWASSVERELVLPPPAPVAAAPPAGDCAVKPPADPPITVLRRRGSRVRLRPAG